MRDDVFRGAVLPGLFRRPSELVVGALQERDEIGNQEKGVGIQVALPRATDRQQGIIRAIQQQLMECLVGIRRWHVGIQSDGLVGFGDRQLILPVLDAARPPISP